jgi:uncharacterized membrane-anchored protein YitT (DUF2179 family)
MSQHSLGYKVPVAENSFQTIAEYINVIKPSIMCRFFQNWMVTEILMVKGIESRSLSYFHQFVMPILLTANNISLFVVSAYLFGTSFTLIKQKTISTKISLRQIMIKERPLNKFWLNMSHFHGDIQYCQWCWQLTLPDTGDVIMTDALTYNASSLSVREIFEAHIWRN